MLFLVKGGRKESVAESCSCSELAPWQRQNLIQCSNTPFTWIKIIPDLQISCHPLDVMCHFYLFLLPLFDFFLTSRYFHVFPFSIFHPYTSSHDLSKNTLSSVFHLPFSIHTSIRHSLIFIFHILPYVSLFRFYYYLSTIYPHSLPSLPNLDNSTFHFL